jgi:hypothetical protein
MVNFLVSAAWIPHSLYLLTILKRDTCDLPQLGIVLSTKPLTFILRSLIYTICHALQSTCCPRNTEKRSHRATSTAAYVAHLRLHLTVELYFLLGKSVFVSQHVSCPSSHSVERTEA